jgi:ubiquinone/menaquinone biosynthesis C-methylase UbiE
MERTNASVYNNEELPLWAYKEGLDAEEDYLISKYIPAAKKESKIVEAGCGSARILLEMHKKGYKNLYGFDLADRLMEYGKKRAMQYNCDMQLSKQSAVSLNYPPDYFDFVIYLQQILSFVETDEGRKKAISECYRILKKDGLGLLSFLWWDGRAYNIPIAILNSLASLLRKGDINCFKKFRYLPWLRWGGKTNLKWLIEDQPHTYWFKADEAVSSLTAAGFTIVEVTSTRTLREGRTEGLGKGGWLYIVVQKK